MPDQSSVIFGRVDVQRDERLAHRQVLNVLLKSVFDISRIAGYGLAQEALDHVASRDKGMAVFSSKFRHNGPGGVWRRLKRSPQGLHRARAYRRAIDQRNDGGIAPAIQHFLKPYLQGTELSAAGIGICNDRSRMNVSDGRQLRFVSSNHNEDKVSGQCHRPDCRREEGIFWCGL